MRKWFAGAMLSVFVLSLVVWYATRDTLPQKIHLAVGRRGGLYYSFSQAYAMRLEERTGRQVILVETTGAAENQKRLRAGKADLALLQAGAGSLDGLSALAPIYEEFVHVVARKHKRFRSVSDLRGKNVIIGAIGSGTREDALRILSHYRIEPKNLQPMPVNFSDLESNRALDAAIVTSGFLNPDLCKLLGSGQFDLLPILDAEALAVRYPCYTPRSIPRGLYAENPTVPGQAIPTVAVKAFLAVGENASNALVTEALAVLYEEDLRNEVPSLVPLEQAKTWSEAPRHPVAKNYFEPYEGLGLLSTFLQSVSAAKELLFALGAGLYLLWDRWLRLREKEQRAIIQEQKQRLDLFLRETMRVEREQMESQDPQALKQYLDEVTCIKLRALEELTHEKLRDNQIFFIFLTQCSSLTSKIQEKIILHTMGTSWAEERTPKR